jgi:hypothetical protein
VTPTKCLVCDVPTVLLEAVGCSAVYDDTCPHRATTTPTNNNGPAPQLPLRTGPDPEERTLNG